MARIQKETALITDVATKLNITAKALEELGSDRNCMLPFFSLGLANVVPSKDSAADAGLATSSGLCRKARCDGEETPSRYRRVVVELSRILVMAR